MALQRLGSARLLTVDRVLLALAAVVIVLAAASQDEPSPGIEPRDVDGLAVVLLVVASGLLLGSGRFPGAVSLVVLAVTFGWYWAGYMSGLVNVPVLVAYYRLGASEGPARKTAVTAVSVVAALVTIAGVGDAGWGEALTAVGYLLMAVLFGELIRSRHLLVEQFARRAQQAEADAERRVVEERMHIARDLHDVLAHTVSAMTVQAGVATDSIDSHPEAAREALGSIRQSGRQAMAEVRAMVAVLRSGTQGADPGGPAPAPHIEQVADLAEAVRERGLAIEMDTDLSGRSLPGVVELTAYRVVQESLTNVVRHADASSVRVSIREEGSSVVVEVRDDGRPVPTAGDDAGAGFGLRGMAERVESIGGRVWHGRGGDGGWTVRATLPLAGGA